MATSYTGNVTPLAHTGASASASPAVYRIGISDLHDALRLGWEDFKAVPSHAIVLCVIYPILGLVLARAVLGYSVLPLLFPLAAGFALIGPFAALGLYELSRRRERGEEPTAWQATSVLRSPSFGSMLGLGVLLLALFVVWVAVAQAIYVATFGYEPAADIPDFAGKVLTTSQGWTLIIAGCGIGLLLARGGNSLVEDGRNVDGRRSSRAAGRRATGRSRRSAAGRATSRGGAGRCGFGARAENRAHDFSENAHDICSQ